MAVSPQGEQQGLSQQVAQEERHDEVAVPEIGYGTRKAIVVVSPQQSTQAEIDDHNILHLPPMPWCVSCIEGPADHDPHFKLAVSEWLDRRMPTVHID